jgi:hypothetical protein
LSKDDLISSKSANLSCRRQLSSTAYTVSNLLITFYGAIGFINSTSSPIVQPSPILSPNCTCSVLLPCFNLTLYLKSKAP